MLDLKPIKKQVTEKDIETYLVQKIKKIGGKANKYQSPANKGVTDRLCTIPYGIVVFVECKRPGKKPTPLQYKKLNDLTYTGHWATWVGTKDEVDELIASIVRSIRYTRRPPNA